jgi:hypothetical protein
MVGAFVLAQELGRYPNDPLAAFARYEGRMRPFVTTNQALIEITAAAGPYGEGGESAVQAALDDAKNAIELDA